MNILQLVSILGAAMAVSFGAIGPALGEGKAVAAAMDAIARQPKRPICCLAPCLSGSR